jgi:hypothetical protein
LGLTGGETVRSAAAASALDCIAARMNGGKFSGSNILFRIGHKKMPGNNGTRVSAMMVK